MQAGLMNTYQQPVSTRSWLAWSLSALLIAAYMLLYFIGPLPALGLDIDLLQRGVLKLENKPIRWKAGQPIRVYAVDL